ncbi:MAG: helix-turn-helix domain-containing protein [Gordonia sp. (in: high G+C Gram-positive bacteria)]
MIDTDAYELLLRLLRGRPRTLPGIRELAPPGIDLNRALTALESAGQVRVEADGLHYSAPQDVLSDQFLTALDEHRARLRTVTELLAVHSVAHDQPQPDPARHPAGPMLQMAAGDVRTWWDRGASSGPSDPFFAAPRIEPVDELIAGLTELAERDDGSPRLLLDARTVKLPGYRERLTALHRAGVRIRLLGTVPWWLCGSVGQVAVMSSDGPSHPVSAVVASDSKMVTRALAAVFADWFDRGVPFPFDGPPNDAALALREQGIPDSEIADLLDVSARTVQRMVAEEMSRAGASSAFELGVWWASRRRAARAPATS